MKDLKEFKYQHQLDGGTKYKAPRSRFDLYCGLLLGVLAVGVIWPAASKWVMKETRTAHAMPAKKLIASNKIPDDVEFSRPKTNEKIVETSVPDIAPARVEKQAVVEREKDKSNSKKEAVAKLEKAKDKDKEKRSASSKKTFAAKALEKKEIRVASRSMPAPKTIRSEYLMDTQTVFTAADVQAKTDAALLKSDVSGASSEALAAETSGPFITISAVQYDKSSLSNCKNRCLLKAKDAKGQTVNAVISGPSFADILMEHQGTINLTGKKSTIKKHEVFLVQNITFNLPDPKAEVANSSKQAPKANVSQPNPAAGTYKGGSEAYEDLGSDLAPR